MSIKSVDDLRGLERVGRIVGSVLQRLKAHVRPGVTTADLDRLCTALLASFGAGSAPARLYGFPGSLCISLNDEAVHGVPGDRVIQAGDLVKLDLVAEKYGYVADAAITVAVPPVTPTKRSLMRCARRAFHRALPSMRAGVKVSEIGRAVEAEVRRCGFTVIRALGGHGVGRAIHEEPSVPNFADALDRRILTDGLVIAVEPIIAAGSGDIVEDHDGWTLRTADGSPAAHYEHTVVVTSGSPLVLTVP